MLQYFLIMSIILLALMRYDKSQAQNGGWRVPENILLGAGIAGGAAGGLLGMWLFRHKTRKIYFWVTLGLAALVHVYLLLTGRYAL